MKTKTIITFALMALITWSASAQGVNERRENQQQRIGEGVEKGQLTPGEAARLERQEKAVNKQVRTDRQANRGKLTPGERKQVNKELNATSKEIHADRTNAATPKYGNNVVDARRQNQQKRIGEGIENGQLNAGQAARLEGQEAKINKQVRQDRAGNGGKLTQAEKRQVNKEQNAESRRIYRNKHSK